MQLLLKVETFLWYDRMTDDTFGAILTSERTRSMLVT